MRSRAREFCRDQFVWRLSCADLADDGRNLARHDRVARRRWSVRVAAICLAPRSVRVLCLHHHSLVLGIDCHTEIVMTVTEVMKRSAMDDDRFATPPPSVPIIGVRAKRHARLLQVGPVLITLTT